MNYLKNPKNRRIATILLSLVALALFAYVLFSPYFNGSPDAGNIFKMTLFTPDSNGRLGVVSFVILFGLLTAILYVNIYKLIGKNANNRFVTNVLSKLLLRKVVSQNDFNQRYDSDRTWSTPLIVKIVFTVLFVFLFIMIAMLFYANQKY